MEKKTALKAGGIAGVLGGCVALYFAGSGEAEVTGLISGAFVLISMVAGYFGIK